MLFKALGTNAVAELRVGVGADVVFDAFPITVIVADVFAVRANRKDSPQNGHFGQRGGQ